MNDQIDSARRGTPLHGIPRIQDPSDNMQIVHIAWMDFFLLNRKPVLSETEIASVHSKAIDLLEKLKEYLPERPSSHGGKGEISGWNVWKAHDLLHQAMYRMKYGRAEVTSAQGAESAHRVIN